MKKKRIKQIIDWPPDSTNAYEGPGKSSHFPPASETLFTKVLEVKDEMVTLEGISGKTIAKFPFTAPTAEIANKIAAIFKEQTKTILELGELEIELD